MSRIGEPRWKCRPTSSSAGRARACFTASSAWPVTMGKPNLLSRTPVVVWRWVCGSTLGDMRSRMGWRLPAAARQPVQELQLVQVVDHHPADAVFQRLPQLLLRLVVAVEGDPLGREVHRAGDGELAAGDDVQAHLLLGQEGGQGSAQVGLGGVADAAIGVAAAELRPELAALVAQGLLVEDVQGRAELARQLDRIAASDGQMAVVVHRRGERQDARQWQLDGWSVLRQGKASPNLRALYV